MCPRCMDCTVGVGSYSPPWEGLDTRLAIFPWRHHCGPSPQATLWEYQKRGTAQVGATKRGEHPWQKGNQRGFPVVASFIGRINKGR